MSANTGISHQFIGEMFLQKKLDEHRRVLDILMGNDSDVPIVKKILQDAGVKVNRKPYDEAIIGHMTVIIESPEDYIVLGSIAEISLRAGGE